MGGIAEQMLRIIRAQRRQRLRVRTYVLISKVEKKKNE